MDSDLQQRVSQWLSGPYDEASKAEVRALNPDQLRDAFYTNLAFGTGGLRGIMGVGTNRINIYTLRAATQGFANYLKKKAGESPLKVVIGYDSRNNSRLFAEECAKVFAGNGIAVLLFAELRPTPLVSFACRHYKCQGAVMITASHNPPSYNGYKVYWHDGGQVLPPHDTAIIAEVNSISDPSAVKALETLNSPLIRTLGEETDDAYLSAIRPLELYPLENGASGSALKVIYSSLHGTGITMVPKALRQWGFTELTAVPSQSLPDGNFPTVAYPNPEEESALEEGIALLKSSGGDLLIATDPDADRMGVAVAHQGEVHLLNGNQIACLCLDHICSAYEERGGLPQRAAFIKSIVTSDLFKAITDHYGAACFDVLTGFKYVAELLNQWESYPEKGYHYIFGAEESYGYLWGTHAHDKDAIVSAALVCETALQAKLKGETLIDRMEALYKRFGLYLEKLHTLVFSEGMEGMEAMAKAMEALRSSPPETIGSWKVVKIEDYSRGLRLLCREGKEAPLALPKTNMLTFYFEEGLKASVRPSGTEPKIKIYGAIHRKGLKGTQQELAACGEELEQLISSLSAYLEGKDASVY